MHNRSLARRIAYRAFGFLVLIVPITTTYGEECKPPESCKAICTRIGAGKSEADFKVFMPMCTMVNCDKEGFFVGAKANYQRCLDTQAQAAKNNQQSSAKSSSSSKKSVSKDEQRKKGEQSGKPYSTVLEYGTDVKAGDIVTAGKKETLNLVLPNAVIRVAPGTSVKIQSEERIELLTGRLRAKIKKIRSKFEVRTSGGAGAVRGTEFQVEVKGGNATFSVLEGIVAVSDSQGNHTVDVNAGYSVVLRKSGAISKPKQFDPTSLTE